MSGDRYRQPIRASQVPVGAPLVGAGGAAREPLETTTRPRGGPFMLRISRVCANY